MQTSRALNADVMSFEQNATPCKALSARLQLSYLIKQKNFLNIEKASMRNNPRPLYSRRPTRRDLPTAE